MPRVCLDSWRLGQFGLARLVCRRCLSSRLCPALAGHRLDVLQELSQPVLGALVVLQTGLERLVLQGKAINWTFKTRHLL